RRQRPGAGRRRAHRSRRAAGHNRGDAARPRLARERRPVRPRYPHGDGGGTRAARPNARTGGRGGGRGAVRGRLGETGRPAPAWTVPRPSTRGRGVGSCRQEASRQARPPRGRTRPAAPRETTGRMRGSGVRVLVALAIVLLGCLLLVRSIRLPPLAEPPGSRAIVDIGDTRLGRTLSGQVAANPGLSGVWPIRDGHDAFADRVLLAEAADRSLDVQYYIWRPDMSGVLLAEALHRAAERGVRVRLLLADNNTVGLDPMLAALDAHENIEVRLFNPFPIRGHRILGYLTDFDRLNRRMHNKSFTADNQATIVGGRNVGNEYFSVGQAMRYIDLDVLAVGPVARAVSADFERYWSSRSSYPLRQVLGDAASVDPGAVPRRA